MRAFWLFVRVGSSLCVELGQKIDQNHIFEKVALKNRELSNKFMFAIIGWQHIFEVEMIMNRRLYVRERIALQLFVFAAWVAMIGLGFLATIQVDFESFSHIFVLIVGCYSLAVLFSIIRDPFVGPAFEMIGAGFALVVPILVSTYLAMSLGFPLADAQLSAMDQTLGFDWLAFITFVDSHPALSRALEEGYSSFGIQLTAVPIILVVLGNIPRACAVVFGYGLLCFISSIVSISYPALGTYSVYGVAQTDLQNIDAHFGFFFLEDFNMVRASRSFVLSLDNASGIITYPSVHAGIAFFIMWAMWDNKWTRWPFVVMNLLMATSAISHANHYLVDVIAGAGIAAFTSAVASYAFLGQRLIIWKWQPRLAKIA